MTLKMSILITGLKRKIDRGEVLDEILDTYINLSSEEKQEIRQHLGDWRMSDGKQ